MSQPRFNVAKSFEAVRDTAASCFYPALIEFIRSHQASITTDEMAIAEQRHVRRLNYNGDSLELGLVELRRETNEGWRVLAKHGIGRFVAGRRGRPTRFVFNRGALIAALEHLEIEPRYSVGAAVAGSTSSRAGEPKTTETITHRFVLRRDRAIALELPADLTAIEAARLARFVESLPFDGGVDQASYDRAWGAEVERRLGEVDRGIVKPIPWSEARKKILEDE